MTLLTLLSGTNSNEKVGLISPLLPLAVSSGNVWKSGPLPFTLGALAPAEAGWVAAGPLPYGISAVADEDYGQKLQGYKDDDTLLWISIITPIIDKSRTN